MLSHWRRSRLTGLTPSIRHNLDEFNVEQEGLIYQPLVPQDKIQSSLSLHHKYSVDSSPSKFKQDMMQLQITAARTDEIVPKMLLVVDLSCCSHCQGIRVLGVLQS